MSVLIFFAFWIILNGRITVEILLFGILFSIPVYLFCKSHIPKKKEEYRLTRNPFYYISYIFYLLGQILIANFHTLIALLDPAREIHPKLIYFNVDLKTEWAKVVLANSITLTPGTITVSVVGDLFCVHAFDEKMAVGLENNGFLERLRKMEVKS